MSSFDRNRHFVRGGKTEKKITPSFRLSAYINTGLCVVAKSFFILYACFAAAFRFPPFPSIPAACFATFRPVTDIGKPPKFHRKPTICGNQPTNAVAKHTKKEKNRTRRIVENSRGGFQPRETHKNHQITHHLRIFTHNIPEKPTGKVKKPHSPFCLFSRPFFTIPLCLTVFRTFFRSKKHKTGAFFRRRSAVTVDFLEK